MLRPMSRTLRKPLSVNQLDAFVVAEATPRRGPAASHSAGAAQAAAPRWEKSSGAS